MVALALRVLKDLHHFVQLVFLSLASLMHTNSYGFVVTMAKRKRRGRALAAIHHPCLHLLFLLLCLPLQRNS